MDFRVGIVAMGLIVAGGPAAFGKDCWDIPSDADRLACYDDAHPPATSAEAPVPGDWSVRVDTSPLDDSKNVYASLFSNEVVPDKYGGAGSKAGLVLRCTENVTAAYIAFNTYIGIGDFDFTYRIDSQRAQEVNWDVSTDNEAAGLWSGGRAIPFIKSLFGADRLFVRFVPYGESPEDITFSIGGVEEAVADVRETCGW